MLKIIQMKNFTKLFLLVLFVNIINTLKAQTISLINNPEAGSGYQNSTDPITLNGNLYFQYLNSSSQYQLAKFDGTNVALIANPDAAKGFWTSSISPLFISYNNNIYFNYFNASNKSQLAKFDGTSVTLITNPDAGSGCFGSAIVFNNNLYFTYKNAANIQQLAKFDGTDITLIANPISGQGVTTPFCLYNNNLFFKFLNSSIKTQLAKFDGTNITLYANPDAGEVRTSCFGSDNTNLYFYYFSSSPTTIKLAKFDGTSINVIPNPDAGGCNTSSTPIAYNGNLYFTYSNSSGVGQLAKYDGTSISLLTNPNTGAGLGNVAQYNSVYYSILHNNAIYFPYYPTSSTSVQQLAKFDGTSISLIGTPLTGRINGWFSDVANLYLSAQYSSTNYQLVKYDGSTLNAYTNPDAGLGLYLTSPSLLNSKLCFGYKTAVNIWKLGTLNQLTPLTLTNFTVQKQNNTIVLNWQTANEINTSHFTIQRSLNGIDFANIGKVNTTGNSHGNYKFEDFYNQTATILYYRLQMMDKDGSFTYSKIVAIKLNAKDNIIIYPNPVQSTLYAQVTGTNNGKATLQISDIEGRVLQQQQVQLNAGSTSVSFNTSTLVKGNYVLIVRSKDETHQKIFTKQ